jgi:predicted aldo/keto reductase-like oxidoreductase
MLEHDDQTVNRRGFLQTGAMASVSSLLLASATASKADDAAARKVTVPTRVLGRTGVEVSILNQGTWKSESLNRILRFAYANGIRYFDTAASYGSEPGIAQWLQAMPEVRKSIFLVTKDHANTPKDMIARLDKRLAALKTDYVDLFFIHGIGAGYPVESLDWPKSKELKETIAAIKKSGKARFVGFSCHDAKRAQYLEAAAEGKLVDAVMVQNTAWLDKDTRLNKALDACHKAGIGLISMKQIAGPNPEAFLAEVPKKAPDLMAKGLTPYGALLHAIWTDERFASVCVSMRNTDQVSENSRAAKAFAPLKAAELEAVRESFLASRPSLCADCHGQCATAGGTGAALGDITRYLTYYERHGFRGEAKRLFAALPAEARNWRGADLDAAREACPSKLDFASLLPRVERDLA